MQPEYESYSTANRQRRDTIGYFNAYGGPVRRDSVDFVLDVGDYIYEYGEFECTSLREVPYYEDVVPKTGYPLRSSGWPMQSFPLAGTNRPAFYSKVLKWLGMSFSVKYKITSKLETKSQRRFS